MRRSHQSINQLATFAVLLLVVVLIFGFIQKKDWYQEEYQIEELREAYSSGDASNWPEPWLTRFLK